MAKTGLPQLHGDSSQYLGTVRTVDKVEMPLEYHRCHSRPIAIKRTTRDMNAEDEIREMENAANEYDWATWRLYSRIIDYRQKHSIKYVPAKPAESQDSSEAGPLKDGNLASTQNQDYSHYGEVFELDL